MMLPATYDDANAAEALAFAGGWIAGAREPGGLFHSDAESVYCRAAMKEWALAHPFCADEIVYFAENGSEPAHLALIEIIAEKKDRNEPLGAVFGAYDIRRDNPLRARPRPNPRGPTEADNFVRDVAISLLVVELKDRFNVPPTQNPATGRPSASSVAALALVESGVVEKMTFKGVEKIWKRYVPVFAGTRFAAKSKRFALGWPADYAGLFGRA
jgi:hypothetical protein